MVALVLAAMAFLSVVLVAIGLAERGRFALHERLSSLGGDASRPPEERALSPRWAAARPAFLEVGKWVAPLLPRALLTGLERALATAGNPLGLNGFLTVWILSGLCPFILAWAVLAAAGLAPASSTLLALLLGLASATTPLIWLRGRVRRRQRAILRSLPDALDLVTTSVEAGLGLDAAFARLVEKTKGPFADELGRALREIAMGRLRREALADLGQRTGVRELIAFINAVIQAEQLGVGIAQVLRVQAEQMRARRRQIAEEAAHRAPIYMVFPLVFFIFPSFLIVILGPGILRIAETLGR